MMNSSLELLVLERAGATVGNLESILTRMSHQLSKSKVDEAARRLARFPSDVESHDDDLVNGWRELHAEPLQKVRETVARRLDRANIQAPVVGRLKRKPQIVKKLSLTSTRLTQMQDVGGCRAVVQIPEMVDEAWLKMRTRTAPWYSVKSVSDYRESGRTESGYRALHVVLDWDGRFIEVQLRTQRQHAWAEGVERVATLLNCELKRGDGPEVAVQFFERASRSFWMLDSGKSVTVKSKKECRRLKRDLDELLKGSRTSKSTSQIAPKPAVARGTNLWLVIYNWREARFEQWMDLKRDVAEASAVYADYERRYTAADGFEVVLIGADSPESFEITHSHYFTSSRDDFDTNGRFSEILA